MSGITILQRVLQLGGSICTMVLCIMAAIKQWASCWGAHQRVNVHRTSQTQTLLRQRWRHSWPSRVTRRTCCHLKAFCNRPVVTTFAM